MRDNWIIATPLDCGRSKYRISYTISRESWSMVSIVALKDSEYKEASSSSSLIRQPPFLDFELGFSLKNNEGTFHSVSLGQSCSTHALYSSLCSVVSLRSRSSVSRLLLHVHPTCLTAQFPRTLIFHPKLLARLLRTTVLNPSRLMRLLRPPALHQRHLKELSSAVTLPPKSLPHLLRTMILPQKSLTHLLRALVLPPNRLTHLLRPMVLILYRFTHLLRALILATKLLCAVICPL